MVDDKFEIPIRSPSRDDLAPVASVRLPHVGDSIGFDCVHFEGGLFRPYIDLGKRRLWTPERCREDPPGMSFAEHWGAGAASAWMLNSPFRPSYVEAADSYRIQARKRSKHALEAARQRATQIAQSGLIFVDGVLLQETRTPGWSVAPVIPVRDRVPAGYRRGA
jgi:hypothetical protein